mmetsp:Transcript_64976/g.146593  ORF Transcript_64976/g.146593 Transcript_64976/m.146593 type:complete len:221 (+) Transcript_64976:789-1451(+)
MQCSAFFENLFKPGERGRLHWDRAGAVARARGAERRQEGRLRDQPYLRRRTHRQGPADSGHGDGGHDPLRPDHGQGQQDPAPGGGRRGAGRHGDDRPGCGARGGAAHFWGAQGQRTFAHRGAPRRGPPRGGLPRPARRQEGGQELGEPRARHRPGAAHGAARVPAPGDRDPRPRQGQRPQGGAPGRVRDRAAGGEPGEREPRHLQGPPRADPRPRRQAIV